MHIVDARKNVAETHAVTVGPAAVVEAVEVEFRTITPEKPSELLGDPATAERLLEVADESFRKGQLLPS